VVVRLKCGDGIKFRRGGANPKVFERSQLAELLFRELFASGTSALCNIESPYPSQIMGVKNRKREREPVQAENFEEAPAKRRRQLNEEHLKLSKLYEDLAAESDEVRFEAAKQLIVKFSPESESC
jgi:hypothetical protein